jgi:serine/threonine protein kinase
MTGASSNSRPPAPDGPGSSLRALQEQLDRFWPGRLAAQSIGRFEVFEELGHGSYGTVFRARDRALECERALKVPNPETLASPRALARFIGEAQKASRIDHPNVVRVFEADPDCVIPYIVMELCSEGSLASWLARRPADLPVPALWAAALVAEIADGVHQAHAVGVLHRDLKPGNILLTRAGEGHGADLPAFRPKVSDFGLARVLECDAGLAQVSSRGGLVGTMPYMSAEQARGAATVRETADVYSLGVILFELVARCRPFSGSSEAEILSRLLDDTPPPSLRTIRPDLPPDLETVCRTAMAKSAGDRYSTAAEFADDLRRFLRDEPIKGSPWWKRARAGFRRRRSLVAQAGLAALCVGLAATGLGYKSRKEASVWLARLKAADVASIPELIAERDPPNPMLESVP